MGSCPPLFLCADLDKCSVAKFHQGFLQMKMKLLRTNLWSPRTWKSLLCITVLYLISFFVLSPPSAYAGCRGAVVHGGSLTPARAPISGHNLSTNSFYFQIHVRFSGLQPLLSSKSGHLCTRRSREIV
jgi:hypothetical protein